MICLAENVVSEQVNGSTILLQVQSGQYYELNETGTQMLALMLKQDDADAAVLSLSDEYDVCQQVLKEDLIALIDELARCRLIMVEREHS